MMRCWERFLAWGPEAEGSTRAIGLLRIALALLAWGTWAPDLNHHPSPDLELFVVRLLFFSASTAMLIGWRSRISTALTAAVAVYLCAMYGIHARNPAWMHHHQYLLACALVWLSLTPCGRSLSYDRWIALRRGCECPERGLLWGQRLIGLQVCAVYFWSAQDKLARGFLGGEQLQQLWMYFYGGSDFPAWLWFGVVCQGLACGVVLLELALSIGLPFPRWHRVLMPLGLCFHAATYLLLDVETFAALMAVLYLAWLRPDRVYQLVDEVVGARRP